MLYDKPEMEILEVGRPDVICTSIGDTYDGKDGNDSPVGGSWA